MNTAFEIAKGLALILSITGSYLVASKENSKRRIGFGIWFISNSIWFINSVVALDITQSLLWLFYNWTCYLGFKNSKN
jgi:hypothetical protein